MNLLAFAFKTATAWRSPAGPHARLYTFIFHRVLPEPDPMLPDEPDAARFYTLLDWIGTQFNVLDPHEAVERLFTGTLPARAAIITFDDGYRDNHEIALPLLRRRGLPALFFIATGYLDGGIMFNDRVIEAVRWMEDDHIQADDFNLGRLDIATPERRAQAAGKLLAAIKHKPAPQREQAVRHIEQRCGARPPTGLMMSTSQLKSMADAGMRIGAHTRLHPMLAQTSDAQARAEINASADDLEAILGCRPLCFAYPNGRHGSDFDDRHADMVRQAGFRCAFTTESGAASKGSDPFQLPRFTPWDLTESRFRTRALLTLSKTGRKDRRTADRLV